MVRLLQRERILVIGGIAVLCVLAWTYLLLRAAGMSEMAGMLEMGGIGEEWTLRELGYLFVMWSVMMVAMMLPSATPTLLLFFTVSKTRRAPRGIFPATATSGFGLGYLLVWAVYSAVAATAQWMLHRTLLLSPAMVSVSPSLSGGLLVAAGAFQFTHLKSRCISHCQSPLSFLMRHWREGARGALVMGIRHGGYCVGCCWALMALLFVLGVMNLLWVTALAILVLVEKTVRPGAWITRVAGAALIGWGVWILLGATQSVS